MNLKLLTTFKFSTFLKKFSFYIIFLGVIAYTQGAHLLAGYNQLNKQIPVSQLQWINGNYDQKSKIVVFWATWCGPCHGQLKYLNSIINNPNDILLINSTEDQRKIDKYFKKNNFEFNSTIDKSGVLARKLGAVLTPTVYIINEEGKIKYFSVGFSFLAPLIFTLI